MPEDLTDIREGLISTVEYLLGLTMGQKSSKKVLRLKSKKAYWFLVGTHLKLQLSVWARKRSKKHKFIF